MSKINCRLTSNCVNSSDNQEDENRQVKVQSQSYLNEYGSRKYAWLKYQQYRWKRNIISQICFLYSNIYLSFFW